jgi:hypothetical protein
LLNSNVGIDVERLNEDAATPIREPGAHKSSRILDTEQSSLDSDATGQKQLAKLYDSWLTLIRCNKVRQFMPSLNRLETLSRIPHNRR